jgi:site-specific recombinase XerD
MMNYCFGAIVLKTIKAYCGHVERFSQYCDEKSINRDHQTISKYSLFLLKRGCSHAYVNQAISAVKFYSQKVLNLMEIVPYIRPKKKNKLSNVLSKNEVMLILKAQKRSNNTSIRCCIRNCYVLR